MNRKNIFNIEGKMISDSANKIMKLSSSSSNCIFENSDERNKKRFSQFSKRKNALSLDKNITQKNKNKFKFSKKAQKETKNSIDIINVFNLIINKYNNEPKENPKMINNSINKDNDNNLIKNIINLDEENDFLFEHDNNITNKNEFALRYLTSKNNNKSFIKLGNNLTTRVKMQNNDFTDSYILALGLNESNNKKNKYKFYQNFEAIKEEKEKENDININKAKFKKAKSLSKFNTNNNKIKNVKKIKLNLSLEKSQQKNCRNNYPKKSLLLINNYYKPKCEKKKTKLKIIKLNIPNYDKNYAMINIERKRKNV